jgi:glucose/arabinose dehydrogenase
MKTFFARALLPAAALLALGGCASNMPERSTAAVPSGTPAPTGTVISPSPVATTAQVVTTPAVTSTGTVVSLPPGTSVVTTTTTPGMAPGVTYVPMQSASIVPGAGLPARLSGGEILSLMSDNTASGVATNGQLYYVYFLRDGRIRFREGEFRDTGSWRVVNDQLCSTMTKTNPGIEQCYTLNRDGTNVSYERGGARIGSFTVLSGDPQNL